jgi:hypothetical protein
MEASAARSRSIVSALIAFYAVAHIGLGAWQLISPGSFFDTVGPFGKSNPHYTRDVGAFTLALGVAFAIAYRWPAWRLGVVGYAVFQYTFHAVNHLADIGEADPKALGPIDFAAVALTALILAWMLREVLRGQRAAPP